MAKILIVDDEQGMRRILNVNLRRDSHVVVEASGAYGGACAYQARGLRCNPD